LVSRIIPVVTFDLVIFGATGDLACRKIFPALYSRLIAGQMPLNASVVGVARTKMSLEEFKALVKKAIIKHFQLDDLDHQKLKLFLSNLIYIALDADLGENWSELKSALRENTVRAFYLSVAPSLFEKISARIFEEGLVSDQTRIVIEKPLGSNGESASDLNRTLNTYFTEEQIYRIDHYLGKETVQNLMALRFSNILFEPLWNSNFVDHVQITVSEDLGISGRGAYYDDTGAIKDMLQNHLMQLLCLTAMEAPSTFNPNSVRDEKLKVIRAMSKVDPQNIVRGQYWDSPEENYLIDANNKTSRTESFVAVKVFIANWRWANTPFYIRTGKKMTSRLSEIAIFFKEPPHSIFTDKISDSQNKLVIRLQPNDGITLTTNIKEPGLGGMRLMSVPLDMTFAETLGDMSKDIPDAYERLIMDVIRGDQTLFMRGDEVEAAWKWVDQLDEDWKRSGEQPIRYRSGSSGPAAADELLAKTNRKWRDLE
jgi:glucose-6-phosphate 1-dehydrogenase